MALNTQSALITQLKYLSGQDNLSDADAVRLLNYALDDYTHLAINSDGKWQVDDTEEEDVSRATTTLAANENKVSFSSDFLKVSFVEIEDGTDKLRLLPYDLRFEKETTPRTDNTGRPDRYDYYGGVMYFDRYADKAYTVRVFFSRPFTHLTTENTSQVIGIPSIHCEYLVFHAMHRLALRNSDSSRAQIRQELMELEQRVQDFYRRRDEDGGTFIRGKMDIRA